MTRAVIGYGGILIGAMIGLMIAHGLNQAHAQVGAGSGFQISYHPGGFYALEAASGQMFDFIQTGGAPGSPNAKDWKVTYMGNIATAAAKAYRPSGVR